MRLERPRRQPAVSTAAFALLSPAILLLLFGAMEGGRVLSTWLIITNEAREGARYGAVRYDPYGSSASQAAAVKSYVHARLAGTVAPAGLSPEPQVAVGSQKVAVTISYKVPLVIPVVSAILPNPFPLVARSEMRGE